MIDHATSARVKIESTEIQASSESRFGFSRGCRDRINENDCEVSGVRYLRGTRSSSPRRGQRRRNRNGKATGRKDASHLGCMQLAIIPHDVYVRRGAGRENSLSLPLLEWKRRSMLTGMLSEGVRFTYCLKLLIGLRTDAAFPCYAILLALCLCLCLCVAALFVFPSRSLYRMRCLLSLSNILRSSSRRSFPSTLAPTSSNTACYR